MLRGLRNNSFLRTVQENIHNLNPKIIKLLIELTAAIRITFTNTTLTEELMISMNKTFLTELVKKILEEADSPLLIKYPELKKIIKMQKNLINYSKYFIMKLYHQYHYKVDLVHIQN